MTPTRALLVVLLLLLLLLLLSSAAQAALHSVNETDTFIVGGQSADITDYPYQAALFDDDYYQFCGGVVVDRRAVITAQHCVESDEGKVFVGVGRSRISQMTDSDTFRAQYIVNYPRYKLAWHGKDFSVLVLDRQMDFSTNRIKPIAVASSDLPNQYIAGGKTAWVSGWGLTNRRGGAAPDRLHSATITMTDMALAQRRSGAQSPDQIAAGLETRGICSGDSGGPLVVNGPSSKVVVGLTSWSVGCADGRNPSWFARTSSFRAWMNRIISVNAATKATTRTTTIGTFSLAKNAAKTYSIVVPRGLKLVSFRLVYPNTDTRNKAVMTVSFDRAVNCRQKAQCDFLAPMEGLYKVKVKANVRINNLKLNMVWDTLRSQRQATFTVTQKLGGNARAFFHGFQATPDTSVTAVISEVNPSKKTLQLSYGSALTNAAAVNGIKTRERSVTFNAPPTGVVGFSIMNVGKNAVTFKLEVKYNTFAPNLASLSTSAKFGSNRKKNTFVLPKALEKGSELGIHLQLIKGKVTVQALFQSRVEWSCVVAQVGLSYCGGVVPEHAINAPVIRIVPSKASTYIVRAAYN